MIIKWVVIILFAGMIGHLSIAQCDVTKDSSIIYYNSGNLRAICYYDSLHNFDGPMTQWFDTGEMEWIRCFHNGLLHGESIHWYANGNVSIKENYLNGMKDGDYFQYNESGNLVLHYMFCRDELIRVVIGDSPSSYNYSTIEK